jgi:hypothetical protein
MLYSAGYDAAAIARRYGAHIGYWSFYVKTGVARLRDRRLAADPRSPVAPRGRARRSAALRA